MITSYLVKKYLLELKNKFKGMEEMDCKEVINSVSYINKLLIKSKKKNFLDSLTYVRKRLSILNNSKFYLKKYSLSLFKFN